MDTPFVIFHSGDKASAELIDYCNLRRIRILTRDIREDRDALVKLLHLHKNTVPQVFTGNGTYIGGYEDTMEVLKGREHVVIPIRYDQEPQRA